MRGLASTAISISADIRALVTTARAELRKGGVLRERVLIKSGFTRSTAARLQRHEVVEVVGFKEHGGIALVQQRQYYICERLICARRDHDVHLQSAQSNLHAA